MIPAAGRNADDDVVAANVQAHHNRRTRGPIVLGTLDGVAQGVVAAGHHRYNRPFGDAEGGAQLGPDAGVARMVEAFKTSASTNYYFEFYVYEDSFDAFVRAREAAARLGFQYGWEPLPANRLLRLSRQAEHVLPQN